MTASLQKAPTISRLQRSYLLDGWIYTVGWPSGWYIGVFFWASMSVVLAWEVSSLPAEPYDAVQSEKLHETGQVYQATGSQGLILSKQLFNVHVFITNIEFLQ